MTKKAKAKPVKRKSQSAINGDKIDALIEAMPQMIHQGVVEALQNGGGDEVRKIYKEENEELFGVTLETPEDRKKFYAKWKSQYGFKSKMAFLLKHPLGVMALTVSFITLTTFGLALAGVDISQALHILDKVSIR